MMILDDIFFVDFLLGIISRTKSMWDIFSRETKCIENFDKMDKI